MSEIRVEANLGASVDEVWKLVGDFAGLVEALGFPVEVTGEGVGAVREVRVEADLIRQLIGDAAGDAAGIYVMAERLEARDDVTKRISYSMADGGPMPLRNYLSTMSLESIEPGRCRLVWIASFTPVGVTDETACSAVRAVYAFGVERLQERFGD